METQTPLKSFTATPDAAPPVSSLNSTRLCHGFFKSETKATVLPSQLPQSTTGVVRYGPCRTLSTRHDLVEKTAVLILCDNFDVGARAGRVN